MKNLDEAYDGPYKESTSPFRQFGWDCKADHRYGGKDEEIGCASRKWLRSRVGHRWSKVYSELCGRYTKPKDRKYLEDRFLWCVELNATKKGGKFYNNKGDEINRDFAVVNDILYETNPEGQRKYRRKSDSDIRWNRYRVWHTEDKVLALINEIWYELLLGDFVRSSHDAFLHSSFTSAQDRYLLYGDQNRYCVEKRQLNKDEIRKLGLKQGDKK